MTVLFVALSVLAVVGPMLLWVWQGHLTRAGRCLRSWEWWRPKLHAGSVIGFVIFIPVASVFGLAWLFAWFA
jgi:hypothetical protein